MGKKAIIRFGISDIATVSKARRNNKFDSIVAIVGQRGDGKSTVAYKVARKCGMFTPKSDLVYDLDELRKRLTHYDRAIIMDEAIYTMYKRDWQKEGQKELIKQLMAYRDHRNLLVLCIPNFWDLDKPLRDLCFLRVDIIRRGMATVHTPMNAIYTQDRWDTANNQKNEQKFILGRTNPKYHKLSTFKGYLKWSALPDDIEKKYQKIKDDKRNWYFEKQEMKENKDQGKSKFIESTIALIKSGNLSEGDLQKVALAQGEKFTEVTRRLNTHLKNSADDKTIKDYFKINKKSLRDMKYLPLGNKDELGYEF